MALAGELDVADDRRDGPGTVVEDPKTKTEQWVAAAWAEVLGIPKHQIGRWGQFFELGGTSLSAVKLVIALNRAVSLKELTEHPILADLATLVDRRAAPRSAIWSD